MIVENTVTKRADILAKVKSLATFRHKLMREGYYVPDLVDLSWNFVYGYVEGTKQLLKKDEIPNFCTPAR